MSCQNNLHQLALACHNYESATGYLPPGSGDLAPGASSSPSLLAIILPYIEQSNTYNQFDFTRDINNTAQNALARDQDVKTYICPSDGSTAQQPDNNLAGKFSGRSNYLGNVGTTADQHGRIPGQNWPAGTLPNDQAHLGVFNFSYGVAGSGIAGGRTVNSRVRMSDVKDGTSNTAMWSETTRSNIANRRPFNWYDPTATYFLPGTDAGWNVYTPQFGPLFNETNASALIQGMTWRCNSWDYGPTNGITYRGMQYYRALPQMCQYTHTVPPNYKGYDCGDDSFTMAHMAARSYHSGGVNVAFCDGSVHFISDSINFVTWQALGTRMAGEVNVGNY